MAVGDRSFPFDNGSANEPEWRELFAATGDGILDDSTGGSFAATVNTGTQEVTVTGGRVRNSGAVLSAPNSEVLALTTGTQPVSGQSRVDLVVVRTDYTANTVVRALLVGTPASTATAVPPALTRNATGVWETPLWEVRRAVSGGTTTITLVDRRHWVGANQVSTGDFFPDAPVPLGTVAVQGTMLYARSRTTGSPFWATVGGYQIGSLGYLTGYVQMPSPYQQDVPRYVQTPFEVSLGGMVYRDAETFARNAGQPFDVTPPLPTNIRPSGSRYLGVVDTFLGPARLTYTSNTGRLNIAYLSAQTMTTQTWWVSFNGVSWVKE